MQQAARKFRAKLVTELAVGAHWYTAHGFDAATDGHFHIAGGNCLRGEMNCLLAGTAESIELQRRHLDREARLQAGEASDIGSLFPARRHAAGHDVLYFAF